MTPTELDAILDVLIRRGVTEYRTPELTLVLTPGPLPRPVASTKAKPISLAEKIDKDPRFEHFLRGEMPAGVR